MLSPWPIGSPLIQQPVDNPTWQQWFSNLVTNVNGLNAIVGPLSQAVINVQAPPYLAQGDGVTDDTSALQRAIDAAALNWHRLFFPAGIYPISTTLMVPSGAYSWWMGAHPRASLLNWVGGASPMISFGTQTQPIVEGIGLDNHGSATVGIQCDSLFATFRNLFYLPITEFTTAMIQSRTDAAVEAWNLTDCYFGGYTGHRSARGLYLHTGNGFSIDHCFFDDLNVGIQAGKTGSGGFDSGLIRSLVVTGGTQFQNSEAGSSAIGVDLFKVSGFSVGGNYFIYSNGVTSPNHLAVKCRTAIGGSITDNLMSGVGQQNYAIECADSTSKRITISTNHFDRLVLAGAHVTAGTDIWCDNNALVSTTAQVVQTNNTFTPALTFGGAAVGITYAANGQVGRFRRVGNTCTIEGFVQLTSKGSSTGAVSITGLPYVSSSITNLQAPMLLGMDTMASMSGTVYGLVNAGATSWRIYQLGTGTASQLTDANFGNGSYFWFQGAYEVADS